MKITPPDTRGWAKVKEAARYAGVSVRTFRDWLKNGLRHSRVRGTGTILISYSAIDAYLVGFEVRTDQVDEIVYEVMKEL